jgi:hypothetical protein
MNAQIDLKSTAKASYKLAAFGDGLTDLTLGLVMIALGTFPLTRAAFGPSLNMLFFVLLLVGISAVLMGVRKRLVPSRLGLVTFGSASRKRLKTGLLITTLLLAVSAVLWGLAGQGWFLPSPSWLSSYGFDIFFALVILGIFCTMAYSLGVIRYYLYGLLFGASMLLQGIALEGLYEGVPMLAAGGIITAIGIYLLVQFLNRFPAVTETEEVKSA